MLVVQLIVIQVITFLGLLFVLRKLMFTASVQETKRLQQLCEENENKSRELEQKLSLSKAQAKEIVEMAENESKRIKRETQDQVTRLKEDMLSKAKAESERMIQQALGAKEKVREELEIQMQGTITDRAVQLVKDLFSTRDIFLLHMSIMEKFAEELEKVDPSRLKVDSVHGQLIAPYVIDAEEKAYITSILTQKIGKPLTFDVILNKSLIAGVVIKMGSLVIDASLSEKLRQIAATKMNK
jgi:F-type H+-transporting ATPase subunit b